MKRARTRLLGTCGLLCVLAAACGGGDPPVEERTVAGYVRETDGTAISGAEVTFVGETLYEGDARTDGDGYYELRVETDSPFGQVRAAHPDFQPAEATVFFDTSERRIDLVLRR